MIKNFLLDRGFRKVDFGFVNFFEERGLSFLVQIEKCQFYESGKLVDKNAFSINFDVLYPGSDRWASIIPDPFCTIRRDGTVRWVNYNCERDGIFLSSEVEIALDLLNIYFDLWMNRLVDAHEGVKLMSWLRGDGGGLPDYAKYMENFAEDDIRNRKYYYLRGESSVRIYDDPERQYRYYAYLNASGSFDWVQKDAWVAKYIPKGEKLVDDAKNKKIIISKWHLETLGLA